MPAALRLTPAHLELVDAYVESLRAIGIHTDPKAVWPARAFGARVGAPQDTKTVSAAVLTDRRYFKSVSPD